MEEKVGMVATTPAILRDLSSSQECWVWAAEEEEEVSLGKRSTEAPSSGDSHLPRSRDQGCRRTPAGHCHRAVRCEALKKRSRESERWEQW